MAGPEDQRASSPVGPISALLGVVALCMAARLWGITRESAWLDEVFSLFPLSEASFGAYWAGFAELDPTTTLAPGYFVVQFLWSRVFGADMLSVRLFSVLLGTLTLAPLFLIGRRLINAQAALIACLCFALALPHVFYAQEARLHVLATLLAACSMWSFLNALDTNKKRWWCLHCFFNAYLLLTSVMTVFLFSVQGVFFLAYHRRPIKRFAGWLCAHVVILLGLMIWFKMRAVENPFWMGPPTWRELANAFVVLAGGRFSNDTPSPYLAFPFSLEALLLLGFAAAIGYVW